MVLSDASLESELFFPVTTHVPREASTLRVSKCFRHAFVPKIFATRSVVMAIITIKPKIIAYVRAKALCIDLFSDSGVYQGSAIHELFGGW